MEQKAGREPVFIMDPRQDEAGGYWRIAFLAGDRPGLFSDIAGVLSLNRVNILSSHIYTWANRTAVDVFHVALPDPGRLFGEIWAKVEDDLSRVFRGELFLRDQLARKREPSILSRPGRPARPAEVRVNNRASDFFTLVEVFADDRVGLLYDITRTLTDLGLDIRIARVSTKADQVADIFYVRGLEGEKVEDSKSTASIRERLLDRLRLNEGGYEQGDGIGDGSSPVSIRRSKA
jgi:[protein-PII] uridylyltransferase